MPAHQDMLVLNMKACPPRGDPTKPPTVGRWTTQLCPARQTAHTQLKVRCQRGALLPPVRVLMSCDSCSCGLIGLVPRAPRLQRRRSYMLNGVLFVKQTTIRARRRSLLLRHHRQAKAFKAGREHYPARRQPAIRKKTCTAVLDRGTSHKRAQNFATGLQPVMNPGGTVCHQWTRWFNLPVALRATGHLHNPSFCHWLQNS